MSSNLSSRAKPPTSFFHDNTGLYACVPKAYRRVFRFEMRARPESTKVTTKPVNKKSTLPCHPPKNKEDTATAPCEFPSNIRCHARSKVSRCSAGWLQQIFA